MNKLTILIENNSKEISDQGSHEVLLDRNIKIDPRDKLFVKTVSVFWDLKNIKNKYKIIKVGSKDVTLEEGYYTFEDIQEKLASERSSCSNFS